MGRSGGAGSGAKGVEVEDKVSSRASNSMLMDLLPIR